MEVYIIGFGGNSRVVADICTLNNYRIMGYFDDAVLHPSVLGKIESLETMGAVNVINSIGDCASRQRVFNNLTNRRLNWINCIHPQTTISPSVTMGTGNIVCAGVVINCTTLIGSFNLINTCAIIEHDCVIGNFNHIAPRSTLCGGVRIGETNFIGAGSTLIPSILLNNRNTVGAMCVVIRNVDSYQKIAGIPGKIMGGNKYRSKWPVYDPKTINDVKDILVSGKVNQWTGSKVFQFEEAFSRCVGVKYSIALANGTVALETCLRVLNLEGGSHIIVPSRTFIASASVINLTGHFPIFTDVDNNSQNITLQLIKEAVTPKTRAVILVHLAGWPCEVEEIVHWCHDNQIYVVEDCAQAHGAKYNNRSVGSFGDINAWSFCQDKIISTGGEGGMITTNNSQLHALAWSFKDHGKNSTKMAQPVTPGLFRWVHDSLGTNYRMTEISASIGLNSLSNLEQWVTHRRAAAAILNNYLSNLPLIRVTLPPPNCYHSYYKYYCFIRSQNLKMGVSRNDIIETLNKMNIPAYEGTCGEIYREKAYGCNYHLPVTQNLSATSLMFPIDPSLSLVTIEEMANQLREIFTSFTE